MKQDNDSSPVDPYQFYSEFLRKSTPVFIYVAVVVVSVLVFALDLPFEILFAGMFFAMIAMGVSYARFVRSKGITSARSQEGTTYQMGDQKWLEPRAYFLRVAIFLVASIAAILATFLVTHDAGVVGVLIAIVAIVWALLIRKGTRRA
jgi:hypothetical protein